MYSIYDLSFAFIQKYYTSEPDKLTKFNVISDFVKVLDSGWTTEDIINQLKCCQNIPQLSVLFNGVKNDNVRSNLIKFNKFYYHNLLRCSPPPPTVEWDINTGTIESKSSTNYFLEMIASITLEQILDYYLEQMKININDINTKRYYGAISNLVEKYGLDLVLFMIDTASSNIFCSHLKKPTTPMAITEYLQEAKDILNQKINDNKIAGDDKIVYRKRVFNYRSRSQTS